MHSVLAESPWCFSVLFLHYRITVLLQRHHNDQAPETSKKQRYTPLKNILILIGFQWGHPFLFIRHNPKDKKKPCNNHNLRPHIRAFFVFNSALSIHNSSLGCGVAVAASVVKITRCITHIPQKAVFPAF